MNNNLPDEKEYKKYNYKLTPFKLCVLQNFPFIEADFDAITNYQLLCKVVEYLNHVIDNQNTVEDNFNIMAENLNTLYNYLDTLDLQEEVNNKLDEMVSDGTFDIILQNLLNIYNEYNFHTLFATDYYRKTDELQGMQGGCVLPDGSIIQCTGNNSVSTGKILHYGTDGTLLNSKTVNYGHCNGVTYCNKTNSIFITSTQDDLIGRYMIFEIDPISLDEISSQDLSNKNFPDEPYGLVYINEIESFIFSNYWYSNQEQKYLWKTDIDFNVISTKLLNINVRSTSNIGRFGEYIGVNTIESNKIMMFNYNTLEFFKEVNINELVSDTWFITEVEWFDTRNNNIYLGFIPHSSTSPRNWGGGTKVVAYFNPSMNYQETGRQNTEFPPSQEIYYVDASLPLNTLRDGSQNAPFRNIYEALNSSLRSKNVIGDVTINIMSDETNDYSIIFSMNKSYRVYKRFDSALKCISSIAINEKAKVFFYGRLILTNGNLINVYDWIPSHIQNRGYFYCDTFVTDSNNDRLILSSSATSSTTFALQDNGMDISNMYGDFYSLYSPALPVNDLIIPNNYPGTLILKRVRNVSNELTINEDNSYQLPLYSSIVFVKIRFQLPNGSSNILREETIIYKIGQYNDYAYKYINSNNEEKILHIYISAEGKMTFSQFNDISQLRVRVTTY